MGYSQPARVPATVANVRLSPSFGAGFCVGADDVPLMVAMAMLGDVPPPGLAASAGTANAAATMMAITTAEYVPRDLCISVLLLPVRLRKAVGKFSRANVKLSWPCRGT